MAIHSIDVIDVATTGMPTWRCACGRSYWSQRGFDRHLEVASTGARSPWPPSTWQRVRRWLP